MVCAACCKPGKICNLLHVRQCLANEPVHLAKCMSLGCASPTLQAWAELDPQATHYIPAMQLSSLICELSAPMGVKDEEGAASKLQTIIMALDIPIRDGKVRHFLLCWLLSIDKQVARPHEGMRMVAALLPPARRRACYHSPG